MIVKFIVVTISLFLIELLYLKIARIKNIKDTPNHKCACIGSSGNKISVTEMGG